MLFSITLHLSFKCGVCVFVFARIYLFTTSIQHLQSQRVPEPLEVEFQTFVRSVVARSYTPDPLES